jgi:HAE1 family hydrophobic/amphiphilic exporter-1
MNLATLSIKRPIFITSIVIIMMTLGIFAYRYIGVDMYPDVTEPGLMITTTYPGAAPEEIEALISKPLEDEMSSLAGLKRLTSQNYEGLSFIIAEFNMGTDIKYQVQRTVEIVSKVRSKLPDGVEDPRVEPFSTSSLPVMKLALSGDLPPAVLYDTAYDEIKPMIEQVDNVASVTLIGGTRREIQVELDRQLLNQYGVSALTVADQLKSTGMNMPVGKHESGNSETVFRTVGNFENLRQIENSVVLFSGDVASGVSVKKLGAVRDGVEDEQEIAYIYKGSAAGSSKGSTTRCILLDVYKQSSTNTVQVSDRLLKRIDVVNQKLKGREGNPRISLVYDNAKFIRLNLGDVKVTMLIGIILAIVVVYLFLGNIRSTIITGIAIPNSILGAFLLMYVSGFTINILTLLALSLTVGLLVDDAIVVRENIFRKLQSGLDAKRAAEEGTSQVMLAVIATSLTVIAVFLPIGFMKGTIGQYFKQFGLTVVFAMMVSLFDALTVAPFLSAYFAGSGEKAKNVVVRSFDRLQNLLDRIYGRTINFAVIHPVLTILFAVFVFFSGIFVASKVQSTFMPGTDDAEYQITLKLPEGTSLSGTKGVVQKIEEKIRNIKELDFMAIEIGSSRGESNVATLNVFMVPHGKRVRSADQIRDELRELVKEFENARPSVNAYNMWGGDWKPFILNISSDNLESLNEYASKVVPRLKAISDLTEVEVKGEGGKPEYQIRFDTDRMQSLGVTTAMAGSELRYHVAGGVVGKLHQNGKEYDIRMRLRPDQRNLRAAYNEARVPNMNGRLIPLSAIAAGKEHIGPTQILRQDRARTVQIMANFSVNGSAGNAMKKAQAILDKDVPLPKGFTYSFWGDAEALQQTVEGILLAFALSIIFIYLILSSLYESFISPVTILLAIPPALSGAFFALFITHEMMNLFSMIGIILLLGLVTKNSILLVDYAVAGVNRGLSRREAIRTAGVRRLRPILMTTFAMIAGTIPVAFGIGGGGKQQASMGIAILGGLIISTLVTLIVVPAVFEYVDRFREFVEHFFRPIWKKKSARLGDKIKTDKPVKKLIREKK